MGAGERGPQVGGPYQRGGAGGWLGGWLPLDTEDGVVTAQTCAGRRLCCRHSMRDIRGLSLRDGSLRELEDRWYRRSARQRTGPMAGTGHGRGREEVRRQEGEQSPVTGKKYTGGQQAGPGRQSDDGRPGLGGGEERGHRRRQGEAAREARSSRPRRGDRSWDLSSFPDF